MFSNNLNSGLVPEGKLGLTVCKLCGALATDGTIYKQRKRWKKYWGTSNYFELTDEYLENVKMLASWVKILVEKEGSIKPNKGSFRFRIGNKILVDYLHSLGFSLGSKTKTVFIPESILKLKRKYLIAFVGSAMMFDGTVKLDGTIEFSTISKKFRDQIVSLLKKEKIHIWKFQKRATKWSNSMKYGFSSRSFDFFLKILEGPKKKKLQLIRYGYKISLKKLLELFPKRKHSKIHYLREIYSELEKQSPVSMDFRKLKRMIEKKHGLSFHRNTISIYLNLLVKSRLIKREGRRYTICC